MPSSSQTANPMDLSASLTRMIAEAMIRAMEIEPGKSTSGICQREQYQKATAHMTMVNQLAQADLGVGVDFKV